MRLLRAVALAWVFAALCVTSAAAGTIVPGTYRLLDHGGGSQGPNYGLRVDDLNKFFSAELGSAEVFLTWDGGDTARIFGTLNENTNGGNGGVGPTWQVEYNLTGVLAVTTLGFTATHGTGTLTDPFDVDTPITGKQSSAGDAFVFLADGHRIPYDKHTPVGRGWLLPDGSVDDWLVRAVFEDDPIPEPGTGLLLGLSLVGIALARRAPGGRALFQR